MSVAAAALMEVSTSATVYVVFEITHACRVYAYVLPPAYVCVYMYARVYVCACICLCVCVSFSVRESALMNVRAYMCGSCLCMRVFILQCTVQSRLKIFFKSTT